MVAVSGAIWCDIQRYLDQSRGMDKLRPRWVLALFKIISVNPFKVAKFPSGISQSVDLDDTAPLLASPLSVWAQFITLYSLPS